MTTKRLVHIASGNLDPPRLATLERVSELLLAQPRGKRASGSCKLVSPTGEHIALPPELAEVIARAAAILARGESLSLLPVEQELTTQQAADLLGISRQYLVRLLSEGAIPYRKTGTHRRIQLAEALKYKATRDKERRGALNRLTRLSQGYGLYDDIKPRRTKRR